jgi:hypothetical protein
MWYVGGFTPANACCQLRFMIVSGLAHLLCAPRAQNFATATLQARMAAAYAHTVGSIHAQTGK